MSYRDVVVGVDEAGTSVDAVRWAARHAVVFGRTPALVHAVRGWGNASARRRAWAGAGEPDWQRAWEVLGRLAARCREETGALVRADVLPGDPVDVLAGVADRAALVVVGHSARGGLARALLPSVAERLICACPRPVVVVPSGCGLDEGRRAGGPVVVGVDGSVVSARALRFGFQFAARHNLELIAVHATSGISAMVGIAARPVETRARAARHDGTGVVGTALAECVERYPGVVDHLVNAAGSPADALLAASRRTSLLVVGGHREGLVRRVFSGSVSRRLIDSAPCPVAVLPP